MGDELQTGNAVKKLPDSTSPDSSMMRSVRNSLCHWRGGSSRSRSSLNRMPYRSRSTLTRSLFISSLSSTSGKPVLPAEEIPVAGAACPAVSSGSPVSAAAPPAPPRGGGTCSGSLSALATNESLLTSPFQASFQSSVVDRRRRQAGDGTNGGQAVARLGVGDQPRPIPPSPLPVRPASRNRSRSSGKAKESLPLAAAKPQEIAGLHEAVEPGGEIRSPSVQGAPLPPRHRRQGGGRTAAPASSGGRRASLPAAVSPWKEARKSGR